jgi:hypothetical protein
MANPGMVVGVAANKLPSSILPSLLVLDNRDKVGIVLANMCGGPRLMWAEPMRGRGSLCALVNMLRDPRPSTSTLPGIVLSIVDA